MIDTSDAALLRVQLADAERTLAALCQAVLAMHRDGAVRGVLWSRETEALLAEAAGK